MNLDALTIDPAPNRPEHRLVVRLKTTAFRTKRGYKFQISLERSAKHSFGHDILDEEFSNIDGDAVMGIVNLAECMDGLYEVVACNESRDWETGYIDSYDLKLVPFAP